MCLLSRRTFLNNEGNGAVLAHRSNSRREQGGLGDAE